MPYKLTQAKIEWRQANRERYRAYFREYKRKWRKTPKAKESLRIYSLKTRYGITADAYNAMLSKQNGRCAICESEPKRRRLHVDHCHSTGVVRGLLCDSCNLGIGMFQDDPALFQRILKYLKRKAA